MLHAMIMAGGGGTRFWPRSRTKRPKQFLTFSGNRTLLQSTVDRVSAQIPPERTWVVTGEQYAAETAVQLPELSHDHIIGEPEGRDTAPCVGLGAAIIARADPDATIVVMPADHVIEPEQEFRRALHAAEQILADQPDKLITFGIRPTFPSTGYGYIKRGASAGTRQGVL
ncbi:MAG TPA: sugar phosphate nucleotidyltransferase, partial [Gemmata sp.]